MESKVFSIDAVKNATISWKRLLSISLASVGARRERYYSGKMPGASCRALLQKMNTFYDLFFVSSVDSWDTAKSLMPTLSFLDWNSTVRRKMAQKVLDFSLNPEKIDSLLQEV